MDDQNNNPGGNAPSEPTAGVPATPPAAEPTAPEPAPEPQPEATVAEQKCVTCKNTSNGGTCVACGQGEVTCTCQPTAPAV